MDITIENNENTPDKAHQLRFKTLLDLSLYHWVGEKLMYLKEKLYDY